VKRLLLLLAVAAIGASAWFLPVPPEPTDDLGDLVLDRPGLTSPADRAIWYCPWAQATTDRDSVVAVSSIEEAAVALTFPVAIPGEPADTASLQVEGPGAAGLTLGEVARRGDSPSFIEFDGGPSAASVTVRGPDVLAADACVDRGPDEWHFPGGSTMPGEALLLRIFNPFPELARVTVTAVSDIGVEALGDFRGVTVNPRSWRDIEFEELLRQRQDLVVTVAVEEGLVIPAMRFRAGEDEDWWPGVGLSGTWEFPVARFDGLDSAALVVSNPGLGAVEVSIDLFGDVGPTIDAAAETIPPETVVRFDLGPVPGDIVGARVVSTGPVAAAVVATGEAGTAVMPGSPQPARRWMMPGLRSLPLEEGTLWLLNTSDEPVSITVSRLTSAGLVGEKVIVDPGNMRPVPITGSGTAGVLAEASGAFSAAWTVRSETGVAFSVGTPIADG